MFGLTRRAAAVSAPRADTLRVAPTEGAAFEMSVAHLPWVLFVRSGDAFFADEAGWWLFGQADGGALALSSNCPGLEGAIRGPLRRALDAASAKLALDLADPPPSLRGHAARAGWAELDAATAAALRGNPTATVLATLDQAPQLP